MSAISKDRLIPVKSILVSQPKPAGENSPYVQLAEKYNLKIDFRQFIKVEPVSPKEFRKQKIDINNWHMPNGKSIQKPYYWHQDE